MKRSDLFFKFAMTFLVAVMLSVLFSCEPQEKEPVPAELDLRIEKTTVDGVTFTLFSRHAQRLYYSCEQLENGASSAYEEIAAGDSVSVSLDGLAENTAYIIRAYAENVSGIASETVEKEFVTGVLPSVSIEIEKVTSSSVTFNIEPVNAVKYGYAVVFPTDMENAEFVMVDSSESGNHTVENLESGTSYLLLACAFNEGGDASEQVYKPLKTEMEPVAEVVSVETDGTSAVAELSFKDASSYGYALVAAGETVPAKADFTMCTISGKSDRLYFYGLEKDKEYSLHVFAVRPTGYQGETVVFDFVCREDQESGRKVVVGDITSFSAVFDVSWDESKYSGGYWIAGSVEEIGDISSFDWKQAIEVDYRAYPVAYQGEYSLDMFNVHPGGVYLVGFVFTDSEGNIIGESELWRKVTLDKVNFGESDCSIQLECVVSAYSTVTYKVVNNGASGYYLAYKQGEIEDLESYAMDIIRWQRYDNFDTEIKQEYMQHSMDYTFVAVPVDENGRYGDIATMKVSTPKPETTVDLGTVEYEVAERRCSFMKLSVKLPEKAQDCLYVTFRKNQEGYETDDKIMEKLVYGGRLYGSDYFVMTNLISGTDYEIWIVPVDNYGRLGSVSKFSEKTETVVFDGNGTVSVEQGASAYDFNIVPDENISHYYMSFESSSLVTGKEDSFFVERFLAYENSINDYETGSQQINASKYYNYIIILPVDKEGRFCKLIRYKYQ